MMYGSGCRTLRDEFNRLRWGLVRLGNAESEQAAAPQPGPPPANQPRVDAWEDGGRLYLEVEVPGVPANSVEVVAEGQSLTVNGERRAQGTGVSRWHRQERVRGAFRWTIALPAAVAVDGLRHSVRDGILYVSAPLVVPAAARAVPLAAP